MTTFFNKYVLSAILASGISLIPASAKAEPTSLLPLTVSAKSASNLLSSSEEIQALAFIEERLDSVNPGCAAHDYYTDLQGWILEGDGEQFAPGAIKQLSAAYRKDHSKPMDPIGQMIARTVPN